MHGRSPDTFSTQIVEIWRPAGATVATTDGSRIERRRGAVGAMAFPESTDPTPMQ
jgi:hypothetical protein